MLDRALFSSPALEDSLIPYQAVQSMGVGPVLVLAPHPDDEVLGCGGAILRHVQARDAVKVIILTDGGYGDFDQSVTDYCQQRRQESREAARQLGYGEPCFWGLPDRGLSYGELLVERITAVIVEVGARLVYAPSPWERHPDHRVLAMAAIEAARRRGAAVTLLLYEVSTPLPPNTLLDITELLSRKQLAIQCFTSQLRKQAYDRQIEALNRFRTYTLPATIEAAEAFLVVRGDTLVADPLGLYVSEVRRQQRLGAPIDAFEQPLVSVIVRTIGRAQLAEALDSIVLQTYPRIEVIVIDARGGADLRLGDWCGRFPMRTYQADRPLARGAAANLGLDKATGEYLIFLDDDDTFFPDHIAYLVAALTSRVNARVAYAGVRVETWHRDGTPGPTADFNEPFELKRLQIENFIPIHAVLFDKAFVNQGCRFDESLERYEDWDFWLQLAHYVPFVHVDRISACYRSQGDSGFGLEPDDHLVSRAKSQFFDKWRQRWSGAHFNELLDYAKNEWPSLRAAKENLAMISRELDECKQKQIHDGQRLMESEQTRIRAENRVSDLHEQIARYEWELVQAQQHLREHVATLAEMRRSTSWRITAPLRRIKSLLKQIIHVPQIH